MSRETLREIRDDLGDPPKGPGPFGGPSQRFGMGRCILPEVQDGL